MYGPISYKSFNSGGNRVKGNGIKDSAHQNGQKASEIEAGAQAEEDAAYQELTGSPRVASNDSRYSKAEIAADEYGRDQE